jgi:hypothetical protein
MALIECNECEHEVSQSAATCPKCGAPVTKAKKGNGCGTLVLGALVIGVIGAVVASLNPSGSTSTSPSAAVAGALSPAQSKEKTLKDIATLTAGMTQMRVNVAAESLDAMVIAIESFNAGAHLYQEAFKQDLSSQEKTQVEALRTLLISRQRQTFPLMRKSAGRLLGKKLWEADVEVSTFGAQSSTVQFVAGEFAANRNIQKAQDAIFPMLVRLRFKKSQYRWIPSADKFTYYTIDSPSDSALAVVSDAGNVTLIDEKPKPAQKAAG